MKWYNEKDLNCYTGTAEDIRKYNQCCLIRRNLHPVVSEKYKNVVDDLENNGYAVIRNAVDRERVLELSRETEELLKDPKNLKLNDTHLQMINQPLHTAKKAFNLATDDVLVNVASEFFKCTPALGSYNLKRSLVNNLQAKDAQLYHCDGNSIKFLKFFFYLTDVDLESGPFTYVEGSHKRKFEGWKNKYRWDPLEIKSIYGADKIKHLMGRVGDVIIANTTGFHRGYPPERKERMMLTVDYVIHPEYWKQPEFMVRQSDVDKLPLWKQPVTDFMIKV